MSIAIHHHYAAEMSVTR